MAESESRHESFSLPLVLVAFGKQNADSKNPCQALAEVAWLNELVVLAGNQRLCPRKPDTQLEDTNLSNKHLPQRLRIRHKHPLPKPNRILDKPLILHILNPIPHRPPRSLTEHLPRLPAEEAVVIGRRQVA